MQARPTFKKGDEVAHWDTVYKQYTKLILDHIREVATFQAQPPALFVQLYSQVQKLCDFSDEFTKFYLTKYESTLLDYVEQDVVPHLCACLDQGHILEGLIKSWENFAMLSYMMKRMFSYLDRFYLRNEKKLGQRALEIFYQHISQSVKDSMRSEIMNEFTKDRNQNVVDKSLV